MEITINKDELYNLIKKAVREVLHEESIDYFVKNLPYVSREEMEDIIKNHGKPGSDREAAYSESVFVERIDNRGEVYK